MTLLLDYRFWAAMLLAGLIAWGTIQTARLAGCQDSLAAARQQIAVMGAQIRQQNAAVDAMQAERAAKLAESEKALQEARRATQAAVGDAARLRAAAARAARDVQPQPGCRPSGADRAVKVVREGL